jgi:glyoxylase-like metal-dependent hydrolase (beta-lactamase superfamily II)
METGSAWEAYPDAIGMRWAIPDLTFTQHISLHWGGSEIILEHHPGPAAGAIWVIIPANKVLFVGDTVVVNQPPFFSVADLNDWAQSLELLHGSYRDFTIISGRGGLVGSDDLRSQQRAIRVVAREMERLAKKNAVPEATEGMIREVLNQYDYPLDLKDYYTQRLKYGLGQYYMRHYRPSTTMEPFTFEEEEQ